MQTCKPIEQTISEMAMKTFVLFHAESPEEGLEKIKRTGESFLLDCADCPSDLNELEIQNILKLCFCQI
jgi:hypothetical protein